MSMRLQWREGQEESEKRKGRKSMCLVRCAVPLERPVGALIRFSSMFFFVTLKRPWWKYVSDGLTTLFYSFFECRREEFVLPWRHRLNESRLSAR